jgi:disulfide bond formation protein DsbB
MGNHPVILARWIALLVPGALIAGAWIFQLAGYPPCEMCHWQRWPHYAAIAAAGASFLAVSRTGSRVTLVALAAILIGVSGAIGAFHAGVEYGWWEGVTACTANLPTGDNFLEAIMAAPVIRCDRAPWSLLGISLAGFNALISLGAAGTILWLLKARRA